MLALPALLLASSVLSVEPVDDPVSDVAAFFLESCAGTPAKQRAACEAGVKRNRAEIAAKTYVARFPLVRLRGGLRSLGVGRYDEAAHGATVKLGGEVAAAPDADVPTACLTLKSPGAKEPGLELPVTIADGHQAELWQKRIAELRGRKSGTALVLETVFRVKGEQAVQGRRCAGAEALAARLVDAESGEILAERLEAGAPSNALESRRLHSALTRSLAATPEDRAVGEYLSIVREKILRNFSLTAAEKRTEPATVRVYIGAKGELVKSELVKASGDEVLDRAVEKALKKSAPFPAPPAALVKRLSSVGAILQFAR